MNRRELLTLAVGAHVLPLRAAEPKRLGSLARRCAALEKSRGGRLGVAVLDTGTGERAGWRGSERFPLCSTFKFLLAGVVLQRVDRGEDRLERLLSIPAPPLLSHSPLMRAHAGGKMPLAELCRAVLVQSDNTAANVLLESLGGPGGITRFCRSIDDEVTRLDRWEPALNEALLNDPRDTTAPRAMVDDLQSLVLGEVLSPRSRGQLIQWMQDCVTGLDRLRARLPSGWRAADKTGTNGEHTTNDIAVFWPSGGSPVVVAAYLTQCPGEERKRTAMLAEIGGWVMEAVG